MTNEKKPPQFGEDGYQNTAPRPVEKKKVEKDSFDIPVEKSPWAVYSVLQIPIVVIMVIVLYFLYQSSKGRG